MAEHDRSHGVSVELPPPSTAVSEPNPRSGQRPGSSRRPRTGVPRRPRTVRPDTSASGIGELPEEQFYPEGEEFDEDEEYESEDGEDPAETFAFHRPQTAAVPVVAFSETDRSAPNTGFTGFESSARGHTFSSAGGAGGTTHAFSSSNTPDPETLETEPIEIGNYIHTPVYDFRHPPPLSGRNNPNNSAFAFSINRRHSGQSETLPSTNPGTGVTSEQSPNRTGTTERSLFDRLHRRNQQTATSAMTGSTNWTATTGAPMSSSNSVDGDDISYLEPTPSGRRPHKTRSKAPLIPEGSDYSNSGSGRRGLMSRGSYGLTEFSGDATVADGQTTYGDGQGGVRPVADVKDGSDESLAALDVDLMEEDSPYPEVRASVSNIDDPEMPGTCFSWPQKITLASSPELIEYSPHATSLHARHILCHSLQCPQHILYFPFPFPHHYGPHH